MTNDQKRKQAQLMLKKFIKSYIQLFQHLCTAFQLLLLFFRHWDLWIIWQVGLVFRSPAITLGRSLIIREYNGKFCDRYNNTNFVSSRTCNSRESQKGLNSPKRFTNLGVSDSRCPQNEKRLSYRKQKSCLGSKLIFVFHSCLLRFHLGIHNFS